MKFAHQPMLHEVIECARIAHEVNRAYCWATGDASQSHWENAPDWQRTSAIAGVEAHIASGLTMTPQGSHESWLAVKKADGWKLGPEKDPIKKRHPCMRPYNELPPEQQVKDALFRAVVHSFFAHHIEH